MTTLYDRASEIAEASLRAEADFFAGIDVRRRIVAEILMDDGTSLIVHKHTKDGEPPAWLLSVWRPWSPQTRGLRETGLDVRLTFVDGLERLRAEYLLRIEHLEALAAERWP